MIDREAFRDRWDAIGTALADILYDVTPAPTPVPEPLPLGPVNAVYIGNDPKDLYQYEAWLGRKADAVQLHVGKSDWSDVDSGTGWLSGVWKDVPRRKFWTIPLIPFSAVLSVAAKGGYNGHYLTQAKALLANTAGDDAIYVRTGWEFNGDWQPWHAKGKEADFAEAFRQFVKTYRSVSSRFVFEWCPDSQGDMTTEQVAKCYPGDEFVDVIGSDIYHFEWNPQDADQAFNNMKWRPWGFERLKAFSEAHKKPMALSEWGVKNPDASDLIGLIFEWMRMHDFLYHSYWNDDGAYAGKLSLNRAPALSDAYRAEFGQ